MRIYKEIVPIQKSNAFSSAQLTQKKGPEVIDRIQPPHSENVSGFNL